ncbi:MAG: transcription-repair coupling factor [Alphaproteobacteria bacterium]|nr:transcription-repair coupling factor [Alphaproteobacteria bacterium]
MFVQKLEGVSLDLLPFCDFTAESAVVFVLANREKALRLHSVFQKTQDKFEIVFLDFWLSDFEHNPNVDAYEHVFSDCAIFQSRAAALAKIADPTNPKIIITTIAALNYKVPAKTYFSECINLKKRQKISMKSLCQKLVEFGYFRTDVVRTQGSFAVRGGIVDLFAVNAQPVRIDFFGDTIEDMKTFDPERQISNGIADSLRITRCSEIIIDEGAKHIFRQRYKLQDTHARECVENGNYFPGIEWFLHCFHERTVSLIDYLPSDTKFVFDFEVAKLGESFFKNCNKNVFTNSVARAKREFETLHIRLFAENSMFQKHPRSYNIRNNMELRSLLRALHCDRKVVFSVSSNGALNILREILKDKKTCEISSFHEAKALHDEGINLITSALPSGFLSEQIKLDVYTELELFGEYLKFAAKPKRAAEHIFRNYSKLSIGDYVVHEKHGIAIFDGLETIEIAGVPRDFLNLRYRNDDRLYVPIENIDFVSRYGAPDADVQVDFLKDSGWLNRKLNVRKKLLVIANDLLKLAAERKLHNSEPFEIPQNYAKFCQGFGHIETDDQLAAINDVLTDLTSDVPMDRLVCGDVGFGKTEIALRAAFVVASALKQVVLLAPTTILVSQHYKNFTKRFASFGIKIRQLSRFSSPKQLRESAAEIKSGQVQIVIATHAVLSEKVEFADLGLVIIDEEQHFGVKQKEFLKRFHASAHFMTLSATPIPRTLQLAVSGVKDLSMIMTPPTDRLPVKTALCNFTQDAIRQAIEAETRVGGQVFFVTPRVEFLDDVFALVSNACPHLTLAKVHGKSPNLEETLRDFCDCKIDVLVSTNIIDSGIDIPNANTILIHRFDLFGLSQLYQLRGRVGRSKRQAYAFLLLDANRPLTENAKKRLAVLEDLNKLGAGFSLAARDLDIRGAGNLLGEEQSGYIKEVGVELYQSMLQEAILMLKAGKDVAQLNKKDVHISLGVPALIPDCYIPDPALRLEMYRRIGALRDEGEVDAMVYELADRFGQLPPETKNLLLLMRIKAHCVTANIAKLDVGSSGFIFSFFDNECKNPAALLELANSEAMKSDDGSLKLRPDGKVIINKKWKSTTHRTTSIYEIVRELAVKLS